MIHSDCFDGQTRHALLLEKGARLCFLGVGGVSMYALALLCFHRGVFVFGQDKVENARTRALARYGVRVYIPSAGAAVEGATAVVASLALGEDDADLLRARARGIPIFTRADLLGALMEEYAASIAVSGTHGKSTVTAALASVLAFAGRDPTVLSGANLPHSEESFRLGSAEYLVAEACEYGDSFLRLHPSLSLFLNLEWDHPDYFPTESALVKSFARAAEQSRVVLYNADSPLLCRAVLEYGAKNVLSVGRSEGCDFRYEIVSYENARATVRFFFGGESALTVALCVPGRFQAENAAMVLAAASYLGVPMQTAGAALSAFEGIGRRLSLVCQHEGNFIYYDYAHHPTEILSGIETLRELHAAPVTVLFRPHTFSRTEALFEGFVSALSRADRIFVTDIDGAREQGGTVDARLLAREAGGSYLPLERAAELLPLQGGPIVLMGAGELSGVLSAICERCAKKG